MFPENVFIQTTVYMLPVWCCKLEKQLVFQIFKNGWLLSNFKNLHFRKKSLILKIGLKLDLMQT